MKLHEFEIGKSRAGARRQREALAEAAGRIGAVEKSPPMPPVAITTRPVATPADRCRVRREHAGDGAVLDEQAPRLDAFEERDRGQRRTAAISARMISRPVPSPPA